MNPPAMAQALSRDTGAADQKQVSAIVDDLETAWNEHDMHALANLFHEDGIWRFPLERAATWHSQENF